MAVMKAPPRLQSLVEEGNLLESRTKCFVIEFDGLERVGAWPKRDDRSGAFDRLFLFQGSLRDAVPVLLAPSMPIPMHFDIQLARQRVHHRDTNTV